MNLIKINTLICIFVSVQSCAQNEMKSIIINDQEWIVKNLEIDKFQNGDKIPEAKTESDWKFFAKEKQPCWGYLNGDPKLGEKYGKLYNWYAVIDPRGLSPKGWHIPNNREWEKLIEYCGGRDFANSVLADSVGWNDKFDNLPNNNEFGFSALPGGCSPPDIHLGKSGYWWSSSIDEPSKFIIDEHEARISSGFNDNDGFSVRCMKMTTSDKIGRRIDIPNRYFGKWKNNGPSSGEVFTGSTVTISFKNGNIIVLLNSDGEKLSNIGVFKDGKIKVSLSFAGETEITYSEENGQPYIYVFGAKMDRVIQ